MVTNSFADACRAANIAKQAWLKKNATEDTETRFALAAAQAGISMIGGVASLIKGIKAKTAQNNVKYTLAIRNLTPFMLVIHSTQQAFKGEGVYPIIKPDETTEWVITRHGNSDRTDGLRIGERIRVGLSIVTDEGDSNADTHAFYFEITDGVSDPIPSIGGISLIDMTRFIRLGSVSWGLNYWEYDPIFSVVPMEPDSPEALKAVYYTAPPQEDYPAPLMVTAVPVSERREELRLEITFLCALPQ
ncbi:hypothetical protein V0288_14575 [Pannus brasiliensis CCIBt3594]|uniref:Uncharacterized protein n=1 Tax=Pannus brasiliensis CCIBt3594 TaxID=1427578 RepID=A0AAW9QW13_9CHRO